jgi:hypothetical protein
VGDDVTPADIDALSDDELEVRLHQHGHLSPDTARILTLARDTPGGAHQIAVLLDPNQED